MTSQRWMLAVFFSLASVLGPGESVTTAETQQYTCRTFGSGVIRPFNGSTFYVRSNCPVILTRFTHNRVDCDITAQRGDNGLLVQVEIIINKIKTVLQNGSIQVEMKSVSLPYDHTYQHIFRYGIYTQLRSSLLPLSVTWHNVPGGIDTVWVMLEQELSSDMIGLCGKQIKEVSQRRDLQSGADDSREQMIAESLLADDTCQTRDPVFVMNEVCRMFFSYTLDCLQASTPHYIELCEKNLYSFEMSAYIGCAFFKEVIHQCGNTTYAWNIWRQITSCEKPRCPGDLVYEEQAPAYIPSCSNPNPRFSDQDLVCSCVCPMGKVLNDRADGYHCVSVSSCPCVFNGQSYSAGDIRSTKCQSCVCDSGKWRCSENVCPAKCVIEGQFVTTVDGKQYAVPGKCTYVASQGFSWTITIEYSKKAPSLKTVTLRLFQETYTFSRNMVKIGDEMITELHQSDHALVFWQSSMYVQVHTSFGMEIQVQMSPEIQLYITPSANQTDMISGLCGNSNNDSTDDFTTSSGIIENSAQPFALSWSVDSCGVTIPNTCTNTENEIYAEEKCSVLNDPTGIFARCHSDIPPDYYYKTCMKRTCNCGGSLQSCLCAALGSYAKDCASANLAVGDWRKATNCTLKCEKNQEFSYSMQACNRTCFSLSGPDPRCGLNDDPVEGCGCPEGTHMNQEQMCTTKTHCDCHYNGGVTPAGAAFVNGRKCLCENGKLRCQECGCSNGKVCIYCTESRINTAQKTCDSLNKPMVGSMTCESGCYCPDGQYEDHRGNCVSLDHCTCVYSGKVFSAGERVTTDCKTCVCGWGQWHCRKEPCAKTCQVYGNGHYQTFDSKWYRFDGHCQYTLVEDGCGNRKGTFSVRVESVPCCDEALTCSRSIILDLQGKVTLTLSDMNVTRRRHDGWTLQDSSLYSTHNVGLYIIITVPSRGITLIWDKHTRITVELEAHWRNQVCGLCGNFDSNQMNDLQISGSSVVSSPLAFGNSWKSTAPPCSDVTTEKFPCEHNSYCSAWAQRRCMILIGDTFKDCHLKVDPEPYYHACVQESCSCEFEGKFLGFCTAVAAYAEACSDQDVCVDWRTPDLCPVYCDYYNERGQCSWHYEACGEMLTCGKDNYFTHKLEGCYPRCSKEAPYYDENTGECTSLRNCTCYFNDTIIQPWAEVQIESTKCLCENGTIKCPPPPPPPTTETSSTTPSTTPTQMTTTTPTTTTTNLTTAETWSTTPLTTTGLSTTMTLPTTTTLTTTETWSTTPLITSTQTTTTTPTTTTTTLTTTETWSTTPLTTTTPMTTATTATTETTGLSTTMTPPTTTDLTTTETWSTTPLTTSTQTTTTTTATTETPWLSTTMTQPITTNLTTTETWSTTPMTTSTQTTTTTTAATETPWLSTTMTQPNTTNLTTTETWSTTPLTTSTPMTTTTTATTETPWLSTTMTQPITTNLTTTETWSTTPLTTSTQTTTTTTATTETTELSTTMTPPTTTYLTTTETTEVTNTPVITTHTPTTSSTTTITTPTSTQFTVITNSTDSTTEQSTTTQTIVTGTVTTTSTKYISESQYVPTTSSTQPTTTTQSTSYATDVTSQVVTNATEKTYHTSEATTPTVPTTTQVCECRDLKRKKSWMCGETWTEDCFMKSCTNGRIELTPVVCPDPTRPICPRGQATKVSDECCETWKCDCRCELYGDPHYISFQGVTFDFLDDCTYVLVEERSPRHHLTIAVDNFHCVQGLYGSCAKGVILKYQNNTATLDIIPDLRTVQATLNNATIWPPYEDQGLKFETTGYIVSIYLTEIRSYVSLSPAWNLVVSLAMEHFLDNTQGQCGVCGGGSCIRKGGLLEDDDCCDKTAYDWVYPDPLKPACFNAPRDMPCHISTTVPTTTHTTTTTCPERQLCDLLDHPVFSNCSRYVDLITKKQSCEFDSCRTSSCSALEQAAKECKIAGFCVEWRNLIKGHCGVSCPEGLVYKECPMEVDYYCYRGERYPRVSPEELSAGCYCPSGQFRATNQSDICVSDCDYCKGPHGEPKLPGEMWLSECKACTCNGKTRMVECVSRPPQPAPNCSSSAIMVELCCDRKICVEKTCEYQGKTYQVGDRWTDAAYPCESFLCSKEGIQTVTRVCPTEHCPEEERIWDDQHCCFTCNQTCAPKMTSINVTIDNCTTVVQMPVCRGQCVSEPRVVLHGDLQVEQDHRCCRVRSSERRLMTLQCFDLTTRQQAYQHVTVCECRTCGTLR